MKTSEATEDIIALVWTTLNNALDGIRDTYNLLHGMEDQSYFESFGPTLKFSHLALGLPSKLMKEAMETESITREQAEAVINGLVAAFLTLSADVATSGEILGDWIEEGKKIEVKAKKNEDRKEMGLARQSLLELMELLDIAPDRDDTLEDMAHCITLEVARRISKEKK